jgi:hypothetical protein
MSDGCSARKREQAHFSSTVCIEPVHVVYSACTVCSTLTRNLHTAHSTDQSQIFACHESCARTFALDSGSRGVYLPRGVAAGKPELVPMQAGEEGVIAGPVKGIGSKPTWSMLGLTSESAVHFKSNFNACEIGKDR